MLSSVNNRTAGSFLETKPFQKFRCIITLLLPDANFYGHIRNKHLSKTKHIFEKPDEYLDIARVYPSNYFFIAVKNQR